MTGIVDLTCNTHAVRVATPRLILREHRPEDLFPLHAILSDPAATWYLPEMRKDELCETEDYLRKVMQDKEKHSRLRFNLAIEAIPTGELIGSVGLHLIEGNVDGAHYGMGYFIRPGLWNQGIATEAARAALDFIFAGDAFRVSAACLAENLASRRVLEKCGMRQEGLLMKHTWHDGQWKDCALYAVLKDEYEGGLPDVP